MSAKGRNIYRSAKKSAKVSNFKSKVSNFYNYRLKAYLKMIFVKGEDFFLPLLWSFTNLFCHWNGMTIWRWWRSFTKKLWASYPIISLWKIMLRLRIIIFRKTYNCRSQQKVSNFHSNEVSQSQQFQLLGISRNPDNGYPVIIAPYSEPQKY